jgi:EAL and modified HD-GYP domain-containing signal transduction protein
MTQANAGVWHYMARQPILDRQGKVHGYYLLAGNAENAIAPGVGGRAPLSAIDNAMLVGIDQLAHGTYAFLPVSYEAIRQGLVEILPAAVMVLHIDEDEEPGTDILQACRRLKELGFRISIGPSAFAPTHEGLFQIADYLKIDPAHLAAVEIEKVLRRAERANVTAVANNINSQVDFQIASAMGFNLFKGYFFCKPEMMKNRTVVGGRGAHFKILEMMQRPEIDVNELANSVEQNIPLAYRLLRLVNSPVCGIRQQVPARALLRTGQPLVCTGPWRAVSSRVAQPDARHSLDLDGQTGPRVATSTRCLCRLVR